jgi:hypothetical protein
MSHKQKYVRVSSTNEIVVVVVVKTTTMMIIINSVPHSLCAVTTATRPITETAQEHKENTKIQATNENT